MSPCRSCEPIGGSETRATPDPRPHAGANLAWGGTYVFLPDEPRWLRAEAAAVLLALPVLPSRSTLLAALAALALVLREPILDHLLSDGPPR